MTEHSSIGAGAVLDDYVLLEEIARGGYGTVWRAARRSGVGDVAVKVLHQELAGFSEAIARFRREAETLAAINHPGVVALEHFSDASAPHPYIAMELLEGVDLATDLGRRGSLPLEESLETLGQICAALSRAHDLGIIHRDLKPSNVMRCGPRVVLLDFGIAKILEAGGPELTKSRSVIGTPCCMAPEQIRGKPVDERTDIYALGALAFHLLTGQPAFADASAVTMAYMHLHGRRPVPSSVLPSLAPLDAVIAKAMARDPEDRYGSVGDFWNDLAPNTSGEVASASAAEVMQAAVVTLLVDAASMLDPDDALLDDCEAVLPMATRAFTAAGFQLVEETGNSALFIRDATSAQDDALEVSRALQGELAARALDPRVGYSIALDCASGSVVRGVLEGPLRRVFTLANAATRCEITIGDGFDATA